MLKSISSRRTLVTLGIKSDNYFKRRKKMYVKVINDANQI